MKRIVVIFIVLALLSSSTVGYAFESDERAIDANIALTCLSEIEEELSDKNTSVEKELIEYVEKLYGKLSETCETYEQEKIESLISQTEKNIEYYRLYCEQRNPTRGVYDPTYSAAVLAIIAWFNFQGYNLSAELLTHAMSNNTLDSYYSPTYGSRVTNSPVYLNIVNGGMNNGSDSFPSSNNTIQADLYYAIHAFNYSNATSAHIFNLSDRYDYSDVSHYSGISSTAVQTMYYAQTLGVIVPFYTSITIFY